MLTFIGLGITDYRYNLGGGGVGVNQTDRQVETPYIRCARRLSNPLEFGGVNISVAGSDGVYNFSADPAGTFYLREAAGFQVPMITLFVNSAVSFDLSHNSTVF
jgi:hypothetical protein